MCKGWSRYLLSEETVIPSKESTNVGTAPQIGPWPYFAPDEIAAATRVLQSGKVNYWTGDENAHFESEFAQWFGTDHAIAVANGSLALDLALIAAGIGPGDEVVVTPRSYFASTSSVVLAGATPVFADVDRESQCVTAESIERVLTKATRAVVPVHLAGWPCDMESIMELASVRDLVVIEDCAQAHGAMWSGRSIGTYGHAAAFSFCQDKIMTTGGEGGMLLTSSRDLWEKAWSFKDHGKSKSAVESSDHPPGFRWLHESFGNNYRLTEMQAAIGRRQLAKLGEWVEARNERAQRYIDAFADLAALRTPVPAPEVTHAYYKFYTFVRPDALKRDWSRDRILSELQQRSVPGFQGSCPEIYLEKAVQNSSFSVSERLPVARELGETSLMFLVHPTLDLAVVEELAAAIADVVRMATR